LKKKNIEKWQRNVIGNITLVDDYLNKREIGAKPPSKYMEEFKKINPKLKQAMKTHLINDLDDCGIWDDNYEKFLEKRSELIWKELKKRFEP